MMDNNDENNNNVNDKPEDEIEEIPYWLQGFKNDIPEETTPIKSDAKEGETWINESEIAASEEDSLPASDDGGETSYPQNNVMEESQTGDLDLDETGIETEEALEDETSVEKEITGALDDREITDEIGIDSFPGEELAEPFEPDPDELPSPEGFVDISDLDLSEPPHEEDEAVLEVEAKEGDLPEWLQEMISEPEEAENEDSEATQVPEEEPIQESVDELDINWEKEDLEDEIMEDEPTPLEEIIEMEITEVGQETDAIMAIADEDTTPISTIKTEEISPVEEEPESIEIKSEEQENEDSEIREEKYQLDNLKSLLNQGEIHQALKIINDLDDETTDFDEISPMLIKAVKHDTQNNSELWEVIGDIALKQDKPHDALDAYTKAIKYLLANSEADDGIS